jgi:hypothetical protein
MLAEAAKSKAKTPAKSVTLQPVAQIKPVEANIKAGHVKNWEQGLDICQIQLTKAGDILKSFSETEDTQIRDQVQKSEKFKTFLKSKYFFKKIK